MRTFAYWGAYNALARAAPRVTAALQRWTRDTGRARGVTGTRAADYFEAVFRDYVTIAGASGLGDIGSRYGMELAIIGPQAQLNKVGLPGTP